LYASKLVARNLTLGLSPNAVPAAVLPSADDVAAMVDVVETILGGRAVASAGAVAGLKRFAEGSDASSAASVVGALVLFSRVELTFSWSL
jgi:hypothetical protein